MNLRKTTFVLVAVACLGVGALSGCSAGTSTTAKSTHSASHSAAATSSSTPTASGAATASGSQTQAQACTIISGALQSFSSDASAASQFKSNPQAAVAALDKMDATIHTADNQVTAPTVKPTMDKATTATDTFVADVKSAMASPSSANESKLVTDEQAWVSSFTALEKVCSTS